jgi:hypothetical protein
VVVLDRHAVDHVVDQPLLSWWKWSNRPPLKRASPPPNRPDPQVARLAVDIQAVTTWNGSPSCSFQAPDLAGFLS